MGLPLLRLTLHHNRSFDHRQIQRLLEEDAAHEHYWFLGGSMGATPAAPDHASSREPAANATRTPSHHGGSLSGGRVVPTQPHDPEPFDGTHRTCMGFLLQCSHFVTLRPQMADKQKHLYIVGLLGGKSSGVGSGRVLQPSSGLPLLRGVAARF